MDLSFLNKCRTRYKKVSIIVSYTGSDEVVEEEYFSSILPEDMSIDEAVYSVFKDVKDRITLKEAMQEAIAYFKEEDEYPRVLVRFKYRVMFEDITRDGSFVHLKEVPGIFNHLMRDIICSLWSSYREFSLDMQEADKWSLVEEKADRQYVTDSLETKIKELEDELKAVKENKSEAILKNLVKITANVITNNNEEG